MGHLLGRLSCLHCLSLLLGRYFIYAKDLYVSLSLRHREAAFVWLLRCKEFECSLGCVSVLDCLANESLGHVILYVSDLKYHKLDVCVYQ